MNNPLRLLTTLLLPFTTLSIAFAGPPAGTLDGSFGAANGIAILDVSSQSDDRGAAVASGTSGHLYVAGTSKAPQSDACIAIARFTPDGVLSPEQYGDGGTTCSPGPMGGTVTTVSDAATQEGDDLLVAGAVKSNGQTHPFVCRFDDEGSLDTGFGEAATPGCRRFDEVRLNDAVDMAGIVRLATRSNEIVLVTSHVTAQSVEPVFVRMDGDGVVVPVADQTVVFIELPIENSFASSASASWTADGRLLVAGSVATLDKLDQDFFVAVVDPATGALSENFNNTGFLRLPFDETFPQDYGNVARALDSGDIVVAGSVGAAAGQGTRVGIAKLHPTGELDASFGKIVFDPCADSLTGCQMTPHALQIDSAGHVIIGGAVSFPDSGTEDAFVLALNADGSPVTAFGTTAPGYSEIDLAGGQDSARSLLLQGKNIVLAGRAAAPGAESFDFALARLADGSVFRDDFE